MRRQRPFDNDFCACGDAVMVEKTSCETPGAFRVRSAARQAIADPRREPQGWRWRRRTDAAEPAPRRTPQIQHPEVKAGMCLDEDRIPW
jgi:hypothetical protein